MRYSVITINYNNRDGLNHTIDSVICQTFKDYEYIIIDGGSTDGSLNVIKKNESYITYWVSEKDKGVYNAMNKGVTHAQGDYCIFMNSGDSFFDEYVLAKLSSYNNGEDIIVGKVFNDKNIEISPRPNREISLYHLYSGAIPHQGAFIKTALLKETPYDESLKITADWKFFIQTLILRDCSLKYVDDIIAKYDTHGISSMNPILMREEKELVLKSLFPKRVLQDYKWMKSSECLTNTLTPKLRNHYILDKFLYRIARCILSIIEKKHN